MASLEALWSSLFLHLLATTWFNWYVNPERTPARHVTSPERPSMWKWGFTFSFLSFFVTTCRSLEQFSRAKKSRVRRNSWHYRSAKSPSFTWARVQFQHRLKCIVEIGQDFIDILQRRNKKFKVSRGLSFNLPVIDEKLPLSKSILPNWK